jgi:glycosyltransferase involved in cell wall biosynthesis
VKKTKILFIIDFIFSITGGTENQIVKIIKNLDREKFSLILLALKKTPWLEHESNQLNCKIELFDYNVFNHKDPKNIFIFFKIVKAIKNIKPDIAITFFPTSYLLGVFAAKIAGVKSIVSTRRDYGLWLNKWNLLLFRYVSRFLDGIITNSKLVKDLVCKIENIDKNMISVIYNGIELEGSLPDPDYVLNIKKSLGITEETKVIGLIAGLRPMKRHRTFIRAAKKMLEKGNNLVFILVGDGPLRTELEDMVNDLQMSENFRFVGWKSPVLPYLSIFNIGVNCSANEGLSNAIMEYMAYGIPCIVSKAGGNPELIKDSVNGYLFELDNSEELAHKLLHLLNDEKLQKQFISKSKEIILKRFSVERLKLEYEEYFEKLIQRN